ncbi:unnamed protein product, partial [marine sediment metagenome]
MKVVVTGQVGIDKKPFLEKLQSMAQDQERQLSVFHVGQMMYAEAPDVAAGRILDLPLARLHGLRRSVIKDVLAASKRTDNLVVNTHATFRWRHGLFPAFDFDQMAELNADLYVTLIDNVDGIHARLVRRANSGL